MLPAQILSQNNPSVLCLKMLLEFKIMLRHLGNSKNLKKKSRWKVVEIVHNLLVKLLQLRENGTLKEWLLSIKEVLHSLSVHFLKMIIVATRRYEYLEKIEKESNNILKLLYDLLGLSEESLVLVIVKASNALGGERNSYGCQFQLFSLLASKVFSLYLTEEDFQEESALVVWSVALARLWLMTCDPADTTKVQKKIFDILPLNVKVAGKRKMSTKGLLTLPITQLVKELGLTASKALKEMDLLLIQEEGSHAYVQLMEMANKVDSALVQLQLIIGGTLKEKKETLPSNDLFSLSSDWTTSTPDRQDAAAKQNSPEVDTGASCSQDFIPSSLKNHGSAEESFENKLKRKRTNRERHMSSNSHGKRLSLGTGENIDDEEKSLKVRKVSPSTKSKGLSENAEIMCENMEASGKGQSLDENSRKDGGVTGSDGLHVKSIQGCKGNYKDKQKICKSDAAGGMQALTGAASVLQPKTDKWKKTRLARTKVETPQKCKTEEILGLEEDFSLRLESDTEESSVDENRKNIVKRALLADTSNPRDRNEIIKKLASESLQADQQQPANNNDDKLDLTFSEISKEEGKFTAKNESQTKDEPQDRLQEVPTAIKNGQNLARKGEGDSTSSREDFEDTDGLGKKKPQKKGSKSFGGENDTVQNYNGLIRGVDILDNSVKLPAGWKRYLCARIVQVKKEPKIRVDVKVLSPDGKSHNCKKSVLEYREKHDPKSVLSTDEIQSWYKIEPQLKERVLEKNEHLVKYCKLRKHPDFQERTLRSYTPLKVNIESKRLRSQKRAKKESDKDEIDFVRRSTNQEKHNLENNIEAKESHALKENQKAGPRNTSTKSKDKNGRNGSLKEVEEEGGALDGSKPLDIHDPFEFTEEEDTIKEFCPVSKTSYVENSVVKREMNVNLHVVNFQENMELSRRENVSNILEQVDSRSLNIKNEKDVLEEVHVKREMFDENNHSSNAQAEPSAISILPTDSKDSNEEYLSIGEDQSQDNSILFCHPCFEGGSVKPSGPESISSQGPEPTSSSDDLLDKSQVLFILPELYKTKVKPGDIICTKVKKEMAQTNSVSSARTEEGAAEGLTFDIMNNCNNISGTPLIQNEKLMKNDSIEILKETSHTGGTSKELISGIICQDQDDQQINHEVKESGVDFKHLKASQQDDIIFVKSQKKKMHSTPAEIVQEFHSPGLSTIKGSSCKRNLQGVVSALNVSSHHPDAQPLTKDIQQVPVLKEVTSDERKALITIPPVVTGKDILLELKWYKIIPSEVGRSFLLESSIVTLSHQEILPPTILEKELLAAREIQLARSSQAEGKSSDTFNDCKRKSCNRQLLEEFTKNKDISEETRGRPFGDNKPVEQSNTGKMDDQVRAKEFSLQVFREGNSMEQSEYGTPMLNSLVQFLDDSQNSDKRLQTPNQGTMLTSCSSKTAINNSTVWSTDSTNQLYNSHTYSNENQLAHSSLSSDHEDLAIIETDSKSITKYLSCAGRLMMPGKNLKRCLYSCLGSHLAQLQEKARMPFEVTSKPSPCRFCSQHQRNETWHSDGLFDPSLLDLSCPICQLTLEDIRPCTFHAELIQLSEGETEGDVPSPLENMTETVRMIYWEYVGILLSLFPGKESLPLPMSWNYMSACSVHAVINPKDLVGTVSSQYVATYSKSGQGHASTSSQEISQDDCQNTGLSISPHDKCQESGQTAKESQQLKKVHRKVPKVKGSALLPDSVPDLHKKKSTYFKNSSRNEKDPSVDKLSRNKRSLQSDKGNHKLLSFLKEKEQPMLDKQNRRETALQPSDKNGNSVTKHSVSKTKGGKPRPTPKPWKFSSLFSKKFLKAKPQSDKDKPKKGKKTKKCAREKKINKKLAKKNVASSRFIVSPNVYSSGNQTKGKSHKNAQLTQDYFDKSIQGQKKKGDSHITTIAPLQKEAMDVQTPVIKNKKSKVRSESDVSISIEGAEFDALERFKKRQKRAMDRSRQKSCVKT
ncbi:uncharacterized protein [Penaeus vannamei]|uniref:uncharacterized protein isoform X1 n=1 Tax=Penaeus vannamei TaxID=6689 RepID=UPI00387F8006